MGWDGLSGWMGCGGWAAVIPQHTERDETAYCLSMALSWLFHGSFMALLAFSCFHGSSWLFLAFMALSWLFLVFLAFMAFMALLAFSCFPWLFHGPSGFHGFSLFLLLLMPFNDADLLIS